MLVWVAKPIEAAERLAARAGGDDEHRVLEAADERVEGGCGVHAESRTRPGAPQPARPRAVGMGVNRFRRNVMRGVWVAVIAGALLWAPATAAAAEKPVVVTGAAANLQPTTVVLNGAVNPRGARRRAYFFQYGTTRLFGLTTPATSAGAGNEPREDRGAGRRARAVHDVPLPAGGAERAGDHDRSAADVQDQAPAARRVAGREPEPGDRRRRHDACRACSSGTGNAGRDVVVKSNPWPYTQGFLPGRQHARHERRRELLADDRVGAGEHPVPRADAGPAARSSARSSWSARPPR